MHDWPKFVVSNLFFLEPWITTKTIPFLKNNLYKAFWMMTFMRHTQMKCSLYSSFQSIFEMSKFVKKGARFNQISSFHGN